VFSDTFCRLPLYYHADEYGLIVSREAKFIHMMCPRAGFDRIGCAQLLAFGLPLGDRTVLEGVKSFPDAGALRAQLVGGRLTFQLRSLRSWNLDAEDGSRTVAAHAEEFAGLFTTACGMWGTHPDSGGNIVSLSGGHDSRGVAAGFMRSGAGCIAVSYRDPNGKREDEVRYARELARSLQIEWHCIDLPPADESAYESLVWLKDGMNDSYMGYILAYLEEILRRWGTQHMTYFSGDGGDDCLKVTAPAVTLRDVNDAVEYIFEKETCMAPDRAEAVLRLPSGTLRAELQGLFESYPEQSIPRRVKRFKVLERARRFYFEGEDRTRSFLWQDSPFYSLPLFRHCMSVPDHLKYANVFCRQALIALSPSAAAVPVTPSGFPPASWKYAAYHRVKQSLVGLPGPLLTLVKRLAGIRPDDPYNVPARFNSYLQEQLSRDTPLAALLDRNYIHLGLKDINEQSFYCFWTVTMLEKAYRSRIG
jgi:asparagine synthase (glutamine-hydrolysing)